MHEDWTEDNDYIDERFKRWQPTDAFGWTWLPTMAGVLETYSMFDSAGEMLGHVFNRSSRLICWAPFAWGEEVYRGQGEDIGEYGFENEEQRWRHFEKIGLALREWVSRKKEEGTDLAILRDGYAYEIEIDNGNHAETLEEFESVRREH